MRISKLSTCWTHLLPKPDVGSSQNSKGGSVRICRVAFKEIS